MPNKRALGSTTKDLHENIESVHIDSATRLEHKIHEVVCLIVEGKLCAGTVKVMAKLAEFEVTDI